MSYCVIRESEILEIIPVIIAVGRVWGIHCDVEVESLLLRITYRPRTVRLASSALFDAADNVQ